MNKVLKRRILCMGLAVTISAAQVISVGAASEAAIKEAKQKTSSQLASANAKIDNLEEKKKDLKAEINELDADLVDILVQVGILEDEIGQKEVQIVETKEDLVVAEADRDVQYDAMKKRIQYLYEKGGDTAWAQMLLEAESITSLLNKAEYTQKLYDYDRESLNKYVSVVEEVTELGNQLETDKADLEVMQMNYQEQEVALETALESKKASAGDYEAQISKAESQAAEYKQLLVEQTAQLNKIEEQRQKAEAEAREKAAQEAARQAAQQEESSNRGSSSNSSNNNSNNSNSSSNNNASGNNSNTEGSSSGGSSSSNNTDGGSSNGNSNSSNDADEGSSGGSNDSSNSSSKDEGSSSSSNAPSSGRGQAVVDYATQFVGYPYVWGGTSLTNGADCSGFTMSVFAKFGVSLPHSSGAQASSGVGVSYSQAQPGDLICYSGHVAIYMGGGSIVHASNAKDGIKISGNAAYKTIVAVRRVI